MPRDPELIEFVHAPETAIRRIVDRALDREELNATLADELIELFRAVPGATDSGLSDEEARHFVASTLQLVEICLCEEPTPRRPLVNALLQAELERSCTEHGGDCWALSRDVSDEARRGTDRRFTFGQIKETPSDPEAPSLFGGLWEVDCDGSLRRVLFSLTADAVASSFEPVPAEHVEYQRLTRRLQSRGAHHWQLQVEPTSSLGQWIARLAGTPNVGQHKGHIPLGVLCDATQRELANHGLTHLLLGPSRRDPPTRPWHTGAFLKRVGDSFDFDWRGHALRDLDGQKTLVKAHCRVRMAAKITILPS